MNKVCKKGSVRKNITLNNFLGIEHQSLIVNRSKCCTFIVQDHYMKYLNKIFHENENFVQRYLTFIRTEYSHDIDLHINSDQRHHILPTIKINTVTYVPMKSHHLPD